MLFERIAKAMPAAARAFDADQHTRRIGRVHVAVLSKSEAIERIVDDVHARRPRLVGFCNAHTVNLAAHDEQLVDALRTFLVLNDGVGVDLASRLLYGRPFPDNLVGTDFVPRLLDASQHELTIFLLGSAEGVANKAAAALQKRYPRHRIVGTHHGFFTDAEGDRIVRAIASASPDLILIGMGQPRQELWAREKLAQLPAVTMCVGAFLEFTAGTVRRAPLWMRSVGLEWLFRLALEPRRLGHRYVRGNLEFVARLLRDYARQRSSGRQP
jgi:alpha-1,3-mannosyltransferase